MKIEWFPRLSFIDGLSPEHVTRLYKELPEAKNIDSPGSVPAMIHSIRSDPSQKATRKS